MKATIPAPRKLFQVISRLPQLPPMHCSQKKLQWASLLWIYQGGMRHFGSRVLEMSTTQGQGVWSNVTSKEAVLVYRPGGILGGRPRCDEDPKSERTKRDSGIKCEMQPRDALKGPMNIAFSNHVDQMRNKRLRREGSLWIWYFYGSLNT